MSIELLPLCSVPKVATRDGGVGAEARLLLPFYGYWYPSGQELTFPESAVAQDDSRTLNGTNQPNLFTKSVGYCTT